ncbi:hypothetical protein BC567DRAFT_209567 [Phyllosticta citribraziliensis]
MPNRILPYQESAAAASAAAKSSIDPSFDKSSDALPRAPAVYAGRRLGPERLLGLAAAERRAGREGKIRSKAESASDECGGRDAEARRLARMVMATATPRCCLLGEARRGAIWRVRARRKEEESTESFSFSKPPDARRQGEPGRTDGGKSARQPGACDRSRRAASRPSGAWACRTFLDAFSSTSSRFKRASELLQLGVRERWIGVLPSWSLEPKRLGLGESFCACLILVRSWMVAPHGGEGEHREPSV